MDAACVASPYCPENHRHGSRCLKDVEAQPPTESRSAGDLDEGAVPAPEDVDMDRGAAGGLMVELLLVTGKAGSHAAGSTSATT